MHWMGKTIVAMLAAVLIMPPMITAEGDACKGYSLVLHELNTDCKNGKDSILTISKDYSVELQPNCSFLLNGCIEITKSFESGTINFEIESPKFPMLNGTYPLCDGLEWIHDNFSPMLGILESMHVDTSCPVSKNSCPNGDGKKIQTMTFGSEMLDYLTMSGRIKLVIPDGSMACVNFKQELVKDKDKLTESDSSTKSTTLLSAST